MKDERAKKRERLMLALRASNEGVWLWDLNSNEIEYSRMVLKFIGYTADSAPHLFSHLETIYHVDDAVRLQHTLDNIFSPNGPELFGENCRFKHPKKGWIWLRIRGACVRDEKKKVIRLAGSIIDITKRKKAERALEEERHLLDLFIESIPVNVYFKDKKSKFVIANTATAEKMGLKSREELLGNSDHNFFSAEHANKSLQDELEIMETQKKLDGSLERETWDGQSDSYCITSKYPWLDNNGKVKGTFGVTNDVSDIVDIQTRLVSVAKQLKQRNAEYEEELNLANEVQQSILVKNIPPLVTEDHRVDIYPEYHPMEALAGDFYEVVTVSKNKIGILMCDVMGHGVRAALIVAMLRGLISKEAEHAHDPDEFLYGLNEGLTKIMHKAGIPMFATGIYLLIDIKKKTLTFANAGHPLPIVLQDNTYRQLTSDREKTSPALGLVRDSIYYNQTVKLTEFTEFLIFTDGIYETVDAYDEELGINGVIEILQANHSTTAKTTKDLLKSLRDYSNNKSFNDDVCLINIASRLEENQAE